MNKFRIKTQELYNGRKFYTAQVRVKKYFLFIPYYSWHFISRSFDADNLKYTYRVDSFEDAELLIEGYLKKMENIQGWDIKKVYYKQIKQQGNA